MRFSLSVVAASLCIAGAASAKPVRTRPLIGPFATADEYFRVLGYQDCARQFPDPRRTYRGTVWCSLGEERGTVSVAEAGDNEHIQFVAIRTRTGWFIDPRSTGPALLSNRTDDRGLVVIELRAGGCDPPDGCFPEELVRVVVCDTGSTVPRCSAPIEMAGYRGRDRSIQIGGRSLRVRDRSPLPAPGNP